MKLSIITINFNNLKGLKETFNSIVEQTWPDYEWIVIDGGSTDGSREFIEEHQDNFSYWCSEPDKGIYNALNKGIQHCNGEYHICMNSGDVFYGFHTLQNVFNKEHFGDIMYGNWIKKYPDYEEFVLEPQVSIYRLWKGSICHQAMFVKTSLLQNEGFDESYKLHADYKRWVDAALNGATFEYVNETICRYDMTGVSSHGDSLSLKECEAIRKSIPSTILCTIDQLEGYERSIQVYRLMKLMNNGGVSSFVIKSFLKLTSFLFKI